MSLLLQWYTPTMGNQLNILVLIMEENIYLINIPNLNNSSNLLFLHPWTKWNFRTKATSCENENELCDYFRQKWEHTKRLDTYHPKQNTWISSSYVVSHQFKSLMCINNFHYCHCTQQEEHYFTDFSWRSSQFCNSYISWRSLHQLYTV